MSQEHQVPIENRIAELLPPGSPAPPNALKSFRYVVGAVNEDALRTWAELWAELKEGVTPSGLVLPQTQAGFTPSCGWPEFLEKFWLLKHYLDYTHRLCRESA